MKLSSCNSTCGVISPFLRDYIRLEEVSRGVRLSIFIACMQITKYPWGLRNRDWIWLHEVKSQIRVHCLRLHQPRNNTISVQSTIQCKAQHKKICTIHTPVCFCSPASTAMPIRWRTSRGCHRNPWTPQGGTAWDEPATISTQPCKMWTVSGSWVR